MRRGFVTVRKHHFDIDVVTVYRLNRKGQRRVESSTFAECTCDQR